MTAPASPLTFEQASAAAKSIHAAHSTSPDPVATVGNMAEQIIATRENVASWAKAAIRGLWAAVDPYSPAQVKVFTEQAAVLMDSAQTAAVRVAAAGQAQQLAAAGIVVDAAPSNPIDVRGSGAVVKGGKLVLQQHAVSVDYAGTGGSAGRRCWLISRRRPMSPSTRWACSRRIWRRCAPRACRTIRRRLPIT
jgi:hypothetical protein